MKNIIKFTNLSGALFLCAVIVVSFTGCSDDDKETATKAADYQFDHGHGAEVTNLDKHKFEHDFAEQCVEREIAKSDNPENDRKRFAKPCMCIATYMMKDLTAVEAEKFLKEKKDTQSLRIRFENAAYHCLQGKKTAKAKSPVIFNIRK